MARRGQFIWCFVYGSNLCRGKMVKAIGGSWEQVERASARGFEVVFNKESTNWGAAANLVPASRKKCKGVVYKISRQQFKNLIRTEGGYGVSCIAVTTDSGRELVAQTFVACANRTANYKRPKQVYLDFVWYGGLEQGLPRRYLRDLIKKGSGQIPE